MRYFAAAGLAILLTGCATPRAPELAPVTAQLSLDAPWSIQGRIAIKAEANSQSGQLQWQHRPGMDSMLLLSPLGQGVARIVRDSNGVTLDIPNKPTRHAPDAESLTREALGVALPLSGLSHWILVRPDPLRPFEQTRDNTGRVIQIRQDGWIIDYPQYLSEADTRPRRINVAREGLEIRLVIDKWDLE